MFPTIRRLALLLVTCLATVVPAVAAQITVTPQGAQLNEVGGAPSYTAVFTVTNNGSETDYWEAYCDIDGVVSDCAYDEYAPPLAPSQSIQVEITYEATTGEGEVSFHVFGNYGYTYGWYEVEISAPPSYSVLVTYLSGPDTIEVGADTAYRFTVKNTSSTSATFSLACSKMGQITCGTVTPSSVLLGAGKDSVVRVAVTGSTTAGAASVILTASGPATDNDSKSLTVIRPYPLTLVSAVGDRLVRAACPIVGAGPGSAVQCGDLLYAHALPGYRTLNRPRNITLLYNSATISPRPVVAVNFARYPGDPIPQAVRIQIERDIGGTPSVISTTYYSNSGFASGPKQVHRFSIPLNLDSLGMDTTAAYPIRVKLSRKIGGSWQAADTASTRLLVVNRTESAFGAGWWPSGIERLYVDTLGALLAYADGSAVYFRKDGSNYIAPPGEQSTLLAVADSFERRLKGGRVKVAYDEIGRVTSVRDTNETNNVARYSWFGERPDSIIDPTNRAVTFVADGSNCVTKIVVPGLDTIRLGQSVHTGSSVADLDYIDDPDAFRTSFTYYDPTHRLKTSKARGTTKVTYWYEARTNTVDSVSAPDSAFAPAKQFRAWQRLGVAPSGQGTSEGNAATACVADSARAVVSWWQFVNNQEVRHETSFLIGRFGEPTAVTKPLMGTTYITRDSIGQAIKIVTPRGAVVQQKWDQNGNLTKSWSPMRKGWTTTEIRIDTTFYEYHPTWKSLTKVIPPHGFATRFELDSYGRRTAIVDGAGNKTEVYYRTDGLIDSIAEEHPTDTSAHAPAPTVYAYDTSTKNITSITRGALSTTYEYDAATSLDVIEATDARGAGMRYEYDDLKRVTKTQQFAPPSSQLADLNTRYGYLDAARTFVTVDPRGDSSYIYRDAAGRLWRSCLRSNWCDTTLYTDGLNPTIIHNKAGGSIELLYDAAGRITRKELRRNNGGLLVLDDTINYEYDLDGNAVAINNTYSTISRAYDPYGRMIWEEQRIRPWNVTYEGGAFHGVSAWHDYDASGRRVRTFMGGTYYGGITAPQVESSDSLLVNVDDSLMYTYNSAGNLQYIGNTFIGLGADRPTYYYYDHKNRLYEQHLPKSCVTGTCKLAVKWTYDSLDNVTDFQPGTQHHPDEWVERDPFGRIDEYHLGARPSSARSEEYTYDGFGRLLAHDASDEPLPEVPTDTFTYDLIGGRQTDRKWEYTYSYDSEAGSYGNNRQQLLWRKRRFIPSPCIVTSIYDDAGNVLSEMWNSASLCNNQLPQRVMTYDGGNRMVTSKTYFYDCEAPNPCHVRNFDRAFWYDGLNRRVMMYSQPAGTVEYVDDGMWMYFWLDENVAVQTRIPSATVDSGDLFLLWPIFIHADTSSATGSGSWFFYGPGPDNLLASVAYGQLDKLRVFHRDIRGNIGHVTTPGDDNLPYAPEAYAPFGNAHGDHSASVATNPGYNGLQSSGALVYMRNRWYDPNTGRFTQTDPIGFAGGVNFYAYAGNNPLAFADPYGLCPEKKRDKEGKCPGGLTVREWERIQEASKRLSRPARARVLGLLEDGRIHAAVLDPKDNGNVRALWEPEHIFLQLDGNDGNVFEDITLGDLANLLAHESEHVVQWEGMHFFERWWEVWKPGATQRADARELQATKYGCANARGERGYRNLCDDAANGRFP